MRTRYEFRVKSDPGFFKMYDPDYEMQDEMVEIVSLYDDDPMFKSFVRVYTKYKKEKPRFFAYVRLEREYSEEELSASKMLRLIVKQVVEPSSEECGTRYDDTDECNEPLGEGNDVRCGIGRRQISNLILDLSRIPKADIVGTIAFGEEWIVSDRFKDLTLRNAIKGCVYRPVEDTKDREMFRDKWFQLVVKDEVEVSIPPSFFADDPFTKNNRHQCSRCGKLKGLRLWSELYIRPNQLKGDIAKTREHYGYRKGVLMPMPFLIVSQRFYQALKLGNMKGFLVEVVREAQ